MTNIWGSVEATQYHQGFRSFWQLSHLSQSRKMFWTEPIYKKNFPLHGQTRVTKSSSQPVSALPLMKPLVYNGREVYNTGSGNPDILCSGLSSCHNLSLGLGTGQVKIGSVDVGLQMTIRYFPLSHTVIIPTPTPIPSYESHPLSHPSNPSHEWVSSDGNFVLATVAVPEGDNRIFQHNTEWRGNRKSEDYLAWERGGWGFEQHKIQGKNTSRYLFLNTYSVKQFSTSSTFQEQVLFLSFSSLSIKSNNVDILKHSMNTNL